MPGRFAGGQRVQQELLRLLRPHSRRLSEQLSERVRPDLAAVARSSTGRPVPEIVAALDAVIREAGGTPDRAALTEFAAEIAEGGNPFEA
jgi:hypothetical protein